MENGYFTLDDAQEGFVELEDGQGLVELAADRLRLFADHPGYVRRIRKDLGRSFGIDSPDWLAGEMWMILASLYKVARSALGTPLRQAAMQARAAISADPVFPAVGA